MMTTLANLFRNIGDSPAAAYSNVVVAALIATAGLIFVHLFISLSRGVRTDRPRWRILTKLIYLGAVASVLILGGTSFYSVLSHGAMHGWFLFLHLIGAGAFVVCLFLIAVMWAMPMRLCTGRCATPTQTNALNDDVDSPPPAARFHCLTKLAFWLILLSGVATAGTMLISMLPLLGTDAMNQMITVHRYAGLVLVVAMLVHLYTVVLARMGRI